MKDWLIKLLGGYTRTDLELSKACLLSMHVSARQGANKFKAFSQEANFYSGKAQAFETAARVIQDIL